MSDVPKIVHDRLRAGAPSGPHPDPDVLAAFAERALTPGERENVVRHLSRCGDCREVVALSLPPIEAVAQPAVSRERIGGVPASSSRAGAGPRTWFAWPTLRWAALAAGVVVVASVLMLRPGKQPESAVATLNKQVESAAPAADASAKPAASSAFVVEPSVVAKAVKPDRSLLREKRALDVPKKSSPAGTRLQSVPTAAGILAGNKRMDALGTYQRAPKVPEAPAADARTAISTSEQVEVSSAQPVVSTETANIASPAPLEDKLMDRKALPPIQKAKAPLKEEKSLKAQAGAKEAQGKVAQSFSVSGAMLARQNVLSKDVAAQWSFAQGVLRRSLDSGATWQTALQLEHPLLSFGARGSEVWAGGQAGTLFHSTDNGATWTQVQPSTKAASLRADIVAIEMRGPAEVVLSTSNHESWTTADGGKTWEKK